MIGKITYWNNLRGYGFIAHSTTDPDTGATFQTQYFFHMSNFEKNQAPVLDALVSFNLGQPMSKLNKRVQAVNVRFASPEEIKQDKIGAGVNALQAGV